MSIMAVNQIIKVLPSLGAKVPVNQHFLIYFSRQNLKQWTKTKVDNKQQKVSGCPEVKIAQL